MRIAFYAPLKPPTHETPSGDRRMARLLMQALEQAGHRVVLASSFRSFDPAGDPRRQERLRREGGAEADRLLAGYRSRSEQSPEAWFTYHVYHKAPDWLGPRMKAELGIPYLIAEASFAPKRAGGPWDLGHRAAARAIAAADRVFCLTRLDMACVRPLLPDERRLTYLPPFLDPAPEADLRRARVRLARMLDLDPERRWLLSVAMMRPGDKLASYHRLGRALAELGGDDWRLVVVGDGPVRGEVESALAVLGPERTRFVGATSPEQGLAELYAACDLYLWPAVGEAYGMAFLEAQAQGLPVVAGRERGVPDVVRDGETGILVAADDASFAPAFAAAVRRLLDDGDLRRSLGERARAFVATERTVAAAAARLNAALAGLRP